MKSCSNHSCYYFFAYNIGEVYQQSHLSIKWSMVIRLSLWIKSDRGKIKENSVSAN